MPNDLLNLVNQLLDFRRMEFQQLKLYPALGDIVAFAREITYLSLTWPKRKTSHSILNPTTGKPANPV